MWKGLILHRPIHGHGENTARNLSKVPLIQGNNNSHPLIHNEIRNIKNCNTLIDNIRDSNFRHLKLHAVLMFYDKKPERHAILNTIIRTA
jgi:cephalosporin hydroxylase